MKPEELRIGNAIKIEGVHGLLLDDAFQITANGIKQFSDGVLAFEKGTFTKKFLNGILDLIESRLMQNYTSGWA